MARQSVLNIGVIGLGPDWESRYGPALAKLSSRIRIRTVYDVTPARAEEVARSIEAHPARGVRQVLSTQNLHAILLLHLSWQRHWLLDRAIRAGVPLFLGEQVLHAPAVRDRLHELIALAKDVLVPEQPIRYSPSMLRVRELLATQLGPVQNIQLDVPAAQAALGQQFLLADLLSWCCVACGLRAERASRPSDVDSVSPSGLRGLSIPARTDRLVRFDVQTAEGTAPPAHALTNESAAAAFCRIVCENGHIDLLSPRLLCWNVGNGDVREELAGDRSAIDVMLDLFARRAAGGLIPVADLNEIRRGEQLAALLLE